MPKFSREHLGQKGACFPGHMTTVGIGSVSISSIIEERLSLEWWRDQEGSGEDASQGWVSWEGGFIGRASR